MSPSVSLGSPTLGGRRVLEGSGKCEVQYRLVLILLGLLLTSCGGGGGGGGGTPTPTNPQPPSGPSSVSFNASASTSGISLVIGTGSSGTRLEIDVVATDVSGVYGLAFDLVFPAGILNFTGSSEGDFLGADGVQTSIQVSDTGSGRLLVGATRLGNVGAMSGSGTVLTLVFQGTTLGSGNLTFEQNEAIGGVGEQVTLSWSGGTVRVSG